MRTRETVFEEIKVFFDENLDTLTDCVLELQGFNGFASDEGIWFPMSELDDHLQGESSENIIWSAYCGRDLEETYPDYHGEERHKPFNPNRKYFRFNHLNNLDSCDVIEYSHLNDDRLIFELEEHRGRLWCVDNDDELCQMFDELEELEE